MPIYYWKRINPARLLVPSFRDSEYLDDDLKDLAGCLLRRARLIVDQEDVFRSALLFQKIFAWIQYLRVANGMQEAPAGSEQYTRLQAQALEWQRAYAAIDVGDLWGAMMSAARGRKGKRASGGQEGVAKPPTLDELRQRFDASPHPPVAGQPHVMSPSGTPMGSAHRDAPPQVGEGGPRQGGAPKDPVWGATTAQRGETPQDDGTQDE